MPRRFTADLDPVLKARTISGTTTVAASEHSSWARVVVTHNVGVKFKWHTVMTICSNTDRLMSKITRLDIAQCKYSTTTAAYCKYFSKSRLCSRKKQTAHQTIPTCLLHLYSLVVLQQYTNDTPLLALSTVVIRDLGLKECVSRFLRHISTIRLPLTMDALENTK